MTTAAHTTEQASPGESRESEQVLAELTSGRRIRVGDRIRSRYRVTRRIGSGGWGTVLEAFDPLLERRVAIKLLRDAAQNARDRFLREARISAAASDASVVSIFDVGCLDTGEPFFVAELIEGEDLGKRIARGPLSVQDTIAIARSVLSALTSLHGKGILHRDLKPENIVLTDSGSVKLVDFGVSKMSEHPATHGRRLTETGEVLGTPLYMSPEQVAGEGVDHRTDLYSLAATMYEMLSHSPPHDARTPGALFAAILRDPVQPLRSRRRDCPTDLERVIHCALSTDPDDRYASAEEMDRALAQCAVRHASGKRARESGTVRRAAISAANEAERAGVLDATMPVASGGRWTQDALERTLRSEPPRARRKSSFSRFTRWAFAAIALGAGTWVGSLEPDFREMGASADAASMLSFLGFEPESAHAEAPADPARP
jgi:serine/threonine protein kinase